jgi:hypothetical protein
MEEFSLSQTLTLVPWVRAEVVTFICWLVKSREVSDAQFLSSFGIQIGIPLGMVPSETCQVCRQLTEVLHKTNPGHRAKDRGLDLASPLPILHTNG